MKLCPNCRSCDVGLYMGFQFGKYSCKDCGYLGPMVLKEKEKSVSGKRIKVCKSLFSKVFGLMFSGKKNLLLLNVNSIHSFFVFFSFDAYFLDEDFRVIEKKRVRPFSVLIENKKARHVLESFDLKYEIGEKVKYE